MTRLIGERTELDSNRCNLGWLNALQNRRCGAACNAQQDTNQCVAMALGTATWGCPFRSGLEQVSSQPFARRLSWLAYKAKADPIPDMIDTFTKPWVATCSWPL